MENTIDKVVQMGQLNNLITKGIKQEEWREWIKQYQGELDFAEQYVTGILKASTILLLLEGKETVGFLDCHIVKSNELMFHDDQEFITEALPIGEEYLYIETMNIRSSYQGLGSGRKAVEMLKNKTSLPILVYVTDTSYYFWYNQGFIPVEGDDYWLVYKN